MPAPEYGLTLRFKVVLDGHTDLGTWTGLLPPSELILPLDTHWVRIGQRLGLTGRRTPNGAMAAEITSGLRRIAPADPLRYDYAVCHLGMSGGCPPRLTARHCARCPLRRICRTGRLEKRPDKA